MEDPDLGVAIPLALDSTVTLVEPVGRKRNVAVVRGDASGLDIDGLAEDTARADENSDVAAIDLAVELRLLLGRLRLLGESDVVARHAAGDEAVANRVVDRESCCRTRDAKVAEDDLRASVGGGLLPDARGICGNACDLAVGRLRKARVDETHVDGDFPRVGRDDEHVVLVPRRFAAPDAAHALLEHFQVRDLLGRHRALDRNGLSGGKSRCRQPEVSGRPHIGHLGQDRSQLRHVDELRETGLGNPSAVGPNLDLCSRPGKDACPCVEVLEAKRSKSIALEKPHQSVDLGNGVRERRGGGKHDCPFALAHALDVADLLEQVRGTCGLRHWNTENAVKLRLLGRNGLEVVRFVDQERVDPKPLECIRRIALAAELCNAVADGGEPSGEHLESMLVRVGGRELAGLARPKSVALGAKERPSLGRGEMDSTEGRVCDDDGVEVAGRRAFEELC